VNLLKTKLRRTSAVIAGSIIGLGGVAVFAAPASAHAPSVDGGAVCVTDAKTWDINWTIGNDYDATAVVDSIKFMSGGKEIDKKDITNAGIAVGDNVPVLSAPKQAHEDQAVKATSKVSTDLDKVTVSVVLKWSDNYINDGQNGHGAPLTKTVEKPGTCEPAPTPSETSSSPAPTPTETTPELPVPTPSTTDEPAEFTPIVKMDCDTITIGMDNPKNGIEWKMGFETSKGEKRNITVAPGEKKTEMFSAKEGFKVKVTLTVVVDGKPYSDFADIDYVKPADCDSSGNGGGLPVTGAAAGGIAGGAAVLLAVGGVLFFMARRRKVKFTA
jgi:hypothetical protein